MHGINYVQSYNLCKPRRALQNLAELTPKLCRTRQIQASPKSLPKLHQSQVSELSSAMLQSGPRLQQGFSEASEVTSANLEVPCLARLRNRFSKAPECSSRLPYVIALDCVSTFRTHNIIVMFNFGISCPGNIYIMYIQFFCSVCCGLSTQSRHIAIIIGKTV